MAVSGARAYCAGAFSYALGQSWTNQVVGSTVRSVNLKKSCFPEKILRSNS